MYPCMYCTKLQYRFGKTAYIYIYLLYVHMYTVNRSQGGGGGFTAVARSTNKMYVHMYGLIPWARVSGG